jgi:phage FluMu protein Com
MTSILGSTRCVNDRIAFEYPQPTIRADSGKEVRCPTSGCGRLICKLGMKSGWIEFRCPRCKALFKIVVVEGK